MSDEGFKNRRQSDTGLRTRSLTTEFRRVVDRLAYFYTPEETRLWLHTPHPMLKSERAIALVNAGRTQEVLAVIDALASGAYV